MKFFDMETIFPKNEYLYTTEINKILKYKKEGKKYFSKNHSKNIMVKNIPFHIIDMI